MRSAAGAVGALTLALSAAPAFAGGYWDAGPATPEPPGAGPPCASHCPPRHAWREHDGWAFHDRFDAATPDAADVVMPADFFAGGGGVGPDAFMDEGGGGGAVIVTGGAHASAFASASASASVRVRFGFRQHCGCMGHGKW